MVWRSRAAEYEDCVRLEGGDGGVGSGEETGEDLGGGGYHEDDVVCTFYGFFG